MAQELNIPGLKEAIADFEKLQLTVQTNAKSLLDMAINAEKAVKAVGGDGLKAYNDVVKVSTAETDKLKIARDKLTTSQLEESKQLAVVTLAIQKQNAANKEYAKSQDESRTSLEKFNAKILESTRTSKELGAQMALMALEGKKNTAEYKNLETQFIKAAETSKKLNDSYRDISKTAGDNRALVGSYSTELKGHFDMINGSISSLKGNIASGNWTGTFNDARNVVKGFGDYLSKTKETAKDFGNEMKSTGGTFSNLKTKVSDAGTAVVNFFKPTEQHSAQMAEGLERTAIGFKRNAETAKEGEVATSLWTKAQLIFSGATGMVSGAFGVLKVAIASTGIGLLIIAVASLVAFFTQTQVGIGMVNKVLIPLKALFSEMVGILASFGEKMVWAFENPKKAMGELATFVEQNLINRFKAFAVILDGIMSMDFKKIVNGTIQLGTGITDATDKAKNLGHEFVKVLDSGAKTAALNKQIRLDTNKLDEEKIANVKKITELELIASRQSTASMAEKHAAAVELIKIKGDEGNLEARITGYKIQQKEIEMSRGHVVQADIKELNELKLAQQEQLDSTDKAKKEYLRAFNGMEKEVAKSQAEDAKKRAEEEKKAAAEAIKTMKITLDNQIANYNQDAKLQDENIAHIQAISLMKQNIARAEFKAGLIDKKGFDEEVIKSDIEKNKALEKVRLEGAKFEIELYDLNNKTLIEDGAQLTDLLVNEEKKRIAKTLEVHRLGLREELNIDKNLSDEKLKEMSKTTGLLTAVQLKYLQGLEKLEDTKAKETKKVDADLLASKVKDINDEVKAEEAKFKLLNKGKLADINNSFKLKQAALNKELALEQTTAKRKLEIAKELADNEMNIARIKDEMVIAGRDRALNNLIEVSGKESIIGKIAGIAQIEIATQKAVMEGWADGMAYGGPAAPYLAALYAGLAGAAGLESIGKVMGISAFATGTDSAPYTGIAMIDEKGAEIHTDKFGNIKSLGSDGGAHLTNIVKGDKIIPADISTMLKQSMALNFKHKDVIDYAEMGRYFDKSLTKVVNAVNNKREASLSVSVQKGISDRVIFKGRNV